MNARIVIAITFLKDKPQFPKIFMSWLPQFTGKSYGVRFVNCFKEVATVIVKQHSNLFCFVSKNKDTNKILMKKFDLNEKSKHMLK